MRSASHLFSLLSLPLFSFAQDGSVSGIGSPTGSAYSCDPTKCKLPNCNCASVNPPGGLSPSEVPMFLIFTADDAVQSYTLNAVNSLLAQRKNPNGCQPKMTYYTSLNYTNYTLVTDWFVAGNEIADHTMTHVPIPGQDEIDGNLIALNALAGIPFSSIIGFRAPYLNYTGATLMLLNQSGFTYDSSSTSSVPVTTAGSDAYWPYTLDYGMANDCGNGIGDICNGKPQLPGFWEVPMYAQYDSQGGIHLMDPWLDAPGTQTAVNNSATLEWLQSTFTDHYNAQRQPFGLYTHPIHIAPNVPGVATPNDTIAMINQFLDWAQEQPNVWIVSVEQVLAWVKNPVPVSQLDTVDALKCSTPDVTQKICSGIPSLEAGLLEECDFPDFPFFTCYGCPEVEVSPSNPNPPQASASGQSARFRIPSTCDTPFWDPIGNQCVCNSSQCQFTDASRPIGSNGANLTGGGTGGTDGGAATPTDSFVPFNGSPPSLLPTGSVTALLIASLGFLYGVGGLFFRL